MSVHDANVISRQANHALNETLRRITRITEYHDISALDRLNAINELVDEDAFLIIQRRHHADALDLDRLIKEHNDKCGNAK